MQTKEFWIPQFKWQLVNALVLRYPNDRMKFTRMNKKQLYAILYRIRGQYDNR